MNTSDPYKRTPPDFLDDDDGLADVWDELGTLPIESTGEAPDVDDAWRDLQARLALGEAEPALHRGVVTVGQIPLATSTFTGILRRAAAIVLLLVGVGGAWSAVPVRTSTAAGERATFQLPDGSYVELNAASSVRHARGFAWLPGFARSSRVVSLEGEAYFDVVSDGRPFVVETPLASVRVLGTEFSVRATEPALEGVAVAVTEGRVEVTPLTPVEGGGAPVSIVLAAGDAAEVDPRGGTNRVDGIPDHLVAWREGAFVAVDRPLGRVLADAGRTFGVRIDLDAPGLETRPMTFYYGADAEVERILADISSAHGLEYRERGPGHWVVRER
jgi:ferric-dicitrate binding protein FerR (iron transport regulator)